MKIPGDAFRLPPDKHDLLQRAKRLEWITIGFLISIVIVVGLTMGASQTMKAMWTEDILSLIPPIAFLIGVHFFDRPPNDDFPYGYRRAVMIACLTGSFAIFAFGAFILIDSVIKLIMAEHPTIQTIALFGHRVWLGWLMIAALVYSVIPPFILGRMKLSIANELHEKALQTDATINKGDWLAGLAAVCGILGLGLGFWWADAAAGLIISIEIVKDGVKNLSNSVAQLMNKRPSFVDSREADPLPEKVQEQLEGLEWVAQARVRLREDGDTLTGEAFVVPKDDSNLLDRLGAAKKEMLVP